MGSVGYDNLMRFNRFYNKYRKLRGQKPFSLSAWIKAKVKSAVNHVNRYEESLALMARKHDCEGMICGHIHVAADRMINGIHYLNSGDWVESNKKKIFHLELGEPQMLTPKLVLKEVSKLSKLKIPGYTPSNGILELRERISEYYTDNYSVRIPAERIFITTGSSGAFLLSFLV